MIHHPILQQLGFGTSLPTHQTQTGAPEGGAVSLVPGWGLPERCLFGWAGNPLGEEVQPRFPSAPECPLWPFLARGPG